MFVALNHTALGLSRECVESALTQLGFDVRVRGEVLQVADFIGLANILL